MKGLDQGDFSGKKVLMRVDFNVPLDKNQNITDDQRIQSALPSIKYLIENGADSICLMSHLGRPKGEVKSELSLEPIADYLANLLGEEVQFITDYSESQTKKIALLENLRFNKAEKKNDTDFAKQLSSFGDVYVNDAFGTAHRGHASTHAVAQFFDEKYAGLLLEKEIKNAISVRDNAERPFTAIVGGAKVSDKILIIEQLLNTVDTLLIGGGMAFTFLKALGNEIGNSLCEDDKLDMANKLMELAEEKDVQLLLPVDIVVADEFKADSPHETVMADEIPAGKMGLDIGEESITLFNEAILNSKTILWNGPMGVFEMEAFAKGTFALADAIAKSTENGAFSLIGGGDSASAIKQSGLADKVSYVSTGGGALLEFFEGKELPGVAALS